MKKLISYFLENVNLSDNEINLIQTAFSRKLYKRKDYLIKQGEVFNFIIFLNYGVLRHFHIKDGDEITCDISLENNFITDFKSFNNDSPTVQNFQFLQDSEVFMIHKSDLFKLYEESKRIESFGRIMAEQVAQRNIDIAMTIASEKPEKRIEKLLKDCPELFQIVPQRYLANLVGITPESFSRIRARKKS